VCIFDYVYESARLGCENADLAVTPSRHDRLTILHKFDAISDHCQCCIILLYFYGQELPLVINPKDVDYTVAHARKHCAEVSRERNCPYPARNTRHEDLLGLDIFFLSNKGV